MLIADWLMTPLAYYLIACLRIVPMRDDICPDRHTDIWNYQPSPCFFTTMRALLIPECAYIFVLYPSPM